MSAATPELEGLRARLDQAERDREVRADPPAISARLQPSYIDVANSLAEDTIFATGIRVDGGAQKVGLFANPFANGREEMLYIDPDKNVRWVRHLNAEADGQGPGGLDGWSNPVVIQGAHQLVVAVHPDGSVWACVLRDKAPGVNRLFLYRLQEDATVPGGLGWGSGYMVEDEIHWDKLKLLPLQYCSNRPATPAVFIDVPDEMIVLCYLPTNPPDSEYGGALWRFSGYCSVAPPDQYSPRVVGIDSPDTVWQKPRVETMRVWSVTNKELKVSEANDRDSSGNQFSAGPVGDIELLGTFTHPHGAGAVALRRGPGHESIQIETYVRVPSGNDVARWSSTLAPIALQDVSFWQDADLLLHVYGRAPDGSLHVIHQKGWSSSTQSSDFPGLADPVWELNGMVLVSRPLVRGVADFVLDPYPDRMANLFVQHEGVDAAEASGMLSQDPTSTMWCEEKIRFTPDTPPKPHVIPRYQTTLTVRNAYGNAVPGVNLKLTADSTVDLEVGQKFYRTDPHHPVTLTTDPLGRVTLRVVATGLAVPQLHVTAAGLSQAVSVQMASDVHAFLKGAGTLPNHSEGFTPDTVRTAKNSDNTPLFPNVQRPPGSDADLPTADDVVMTVRQILSSTTTSVPPTLAPSWRLETGEEVLGVSFQTHDPNRPAFQVFTSAEEMAAHKLALPDWDEVTAWLGDAWAAVRNAAATVNEYFIDFVEGTIVVGIQLAELTVYAVNWVINGIQSAVAAVEAVFSAIGATIDDVINWLKWLFDFKMALKTAKALEGALAEAPKLLTSALSAFGEIAHDFFINQEDKVQEWFESIKASVAGTSYASLQGPTGSVPSQSQPSPQTSSTADATSSPHAHWLFEKLLNNGEGTGAARDALVVDPIEDMITELVEAVYSKSATEELLAAGYDVGQLFGNLFSGKDPAAVLATEIVTLIDLGEHVVLALLKWLDDVVHFLIDWTKRVVTYSFTALAAPLDTSPLIETLWAFVLEEAEVDPDDYPLSVGMIGMFLAAYPFTLVWKMADGGADPFPDGVPMPTTQGSTPILQDAQWTTSLAAFQAFQGAVQTFDAFLDALLNYSALTTDPVTKEKGWRVPDVVNQGFAAAHFVAYVIGDHPYFWGYKQPPVSTEIEILPYVRYAFTFYFNNVDLLTAFTTGSLAQAFEPNPDDPLREQKEWTFAASTFAFGWMRIGAQIAEYLQIEPVKGRPPSWFEKWNLWINLTAYIQTATGIVRYFYGKAPNDAVAVVVVVKAVMDVVCDVYSGISTVIQPLQELVTPPVIPLPSKDHDYVLFEDGYRWAPYESTRLSVEGGYPTFSWTTSPTGDFSDPDAGLPVGLHLEVTDSAGYGGKYVRVVGWPEEWMDNVEGTLLVEDGYGPGLTNAVKFILPVFTAPDGVPQEVTFTATPSEGHAPLSVAFKDTTGGSTMWYWDFGDGVTIYERDPVHVYATPGRYRVTHRASNAIGWGRPNVTEILVEA